MSKGKVSMIVACLLAFLVSCAASAIAIYLILSPPETEFTVSGQALSPACEQDLVDYLRGAEILPYKDFVVGGRAYEWFEENLDELVAEIEAEIGTSYEYTGICFLGEYVVFSYDLPRSAVQVIAKVQGDGSLEIVYFYYPFGNPNLGQS